jgi:hypothetical protein
LQTDGVFLISVIQKVYNEEDNLAHKATPKEHSPFTLDNSLVTNLIIQSYPPTSERLFKDFLRVTKVTILNNHLTNLST